MPTHPDDGLEWTIAIVHSAVRRAIECSSSSYNPSASKRPERIEAAPIVFPLGCIGSALRRENEFGRGP